jgi:predicted O-methyltransferase YrrM
MNLDFAAIRAGFRRESLCLRAARPTTRAVMDEIIDHDRFPGATDPAPLDLLWLLIKKVKPSKVLQLGTLIGYSAILIAETLAQNERGHLITVDPDRTGHALARDWARRAGLSSWVDFVDDYSTGPETALVLAGAAPFDLVYLDASHAYEETLRELDLLLLNGGWLADHGILVAHDASVFARQYDPTHRGGVRRALDEWIDDHPRLMHHMIFEPPLWPSQAGLAILARRLDATSAS